MRKLYLVAYDIADPGRLRRVHQAVREYATGGQKSVFECFLTPAEAVRLLQSVRERIDPTEDAFLILKLDPRARTVPLGIARAPEDPPLFFYHA